MKKKDKNQVDRYGLIKIEDGTNGVYAWSSPHYKQTVELTDEEKAVCEAKNLDAESVLWVKRELAAGRTPTQIHRSIGMSRNTVYKYKEILKDSLQSTGETPAKYSQSTEIKKSVLCFFLFFNHLDHQSTLLILIAGICTIGLPFFVHRLQIWAFERREARRKEIRPLRIDFHLAMDFKYRKEALTARNTEEKLYFHYLLREYGNRTREVFLNEILSGESAINHKIRRDKVAEQYNINNALKVRNAEKKMLAAKNELYHTGKLDYFYKNDKEQREASRLWLVEFTRPIVERRAKDNLEPLTTQPLEL